MSNLTQLRVWDLPTRLSHWLMVALCGCSWWSAETHQMDYHRYSGYALLGVVIFRLYWGVVGSDTARFTHFVRGPRALLLYLQQRSSHTPGHNPLGALSVLLLLSLLLTQIVLGLFAVDVDGMESGPWSSKVSFDTGRELAMWHGRIFIGLQAAVALHVVAILFYLFIKCDNLIRPMISGYKSWPHELPSLKFASWPLALAGMMLAAVMVWWLVSWLVSS